MEDREMPEDKPTVPPQPLTTRLPAVTVQGDTLQGILVTLQEIKAGQSEHGRLITELRDDHDELRRQVEAQRKANSDAARQPSEHDLNAIAELEKERAARAELARDLEANTEATRELATKLENHSKDVAKDVGELKAELASNSESTEAVKNAIVVTVTGLGSFLKAHKAEVAGLFAAACGWAAHWFATH